MEVRSPARSCQPVSTHRRRRRPGPRYSPAVLDGTAGCMAISVSELYDALVEAVISRHEAEHQLVTKADVAASESALKADIAAVGSAPRGEIADLHAEMLAMKAEIIKWSVGTVLAAVGLTVAVVRLLG